MFASKTLPEAAPLQKVLKVISAQLLADFAGAVYVGPQTLDAGVLHYFNEPVTGSSFVVWDRALSLEFVEARMKATRIRFGVA